MCYTGNTAARFTLRLDMLELLLGFETGATTTTAVIVVAVAAVVVFVVCSDETGAIAFALAVT